MRYLIVVTRENCSTIVLREPYQDKIHREKCLLPTPVSTPVSDDTGPDVVFPPQTPRGLSVLTDINETRKKRNQSFDDDNRSDPTGPSVNEEMSEKVHIITTYFIENFVVIFIIFHIRKPLRSCEVEKESTQI